MTSSLLLAACSGTHPGEQDGGGMSTPTEPSDGGAADAGTPHDPRDAADADVEVCGVARRGPVLHVAEGGDDGAACSEEQPCATLQHAADQAEPGSVVR